MGNSPSTGFSLPTCLLETSPPRKAFSPLLSGISVRFRPAVFPKTKGTVSTFSLTGNGLYSNKLILTTLQFWRLQLGNNRAGDLD